MKSIKSSGQGRTATLHLRVLRRKSDAEPEGSKMERQAQTESATSWQVELLLPEPPHTVRALYNFPSPQEAWNWGRIALEIMQGFVLVAAWRVVGSDQPPTHTTEGFRVVKLGSPLRQ